MDTLTDWLQVLVSAAGVLATVGTLYYAIVSGRQSNLQAQEALRESIENRKDDVMPILALNKRNHFGGNSAHITFYLENTGNGPIYDLKIKSPSEGSFVRYEPNDGKDKLYYIGCTIEALRSKKHRIITYSYKDIYGRQFLANQEYNVNSSSPGDITIDGHFTIPMKK